MDSARGNFEIFVISLGEAAFFLLKNEKKVKVNAFSFGQTP
jgi:hypothetical protein